MTTSPVLVRSVPAHRKLWLRGKLTEKRAKLLIAALRKLNRSSHDPIILMINSRGGSFEWAHRIVKTIESSSAPVYALITKAYSAAFIVALSCTRRLGRTKSLYNAHYNRLNLSFVAATPYMDTESLKKFLDETFEPFLRKQWMDSPFRQIVLRRVRSVGKTEQQLNELMQRDRILDAKEALEWGFIDEIVRT
jgi:ATP-dependent protease ClpP protease subunit